MQKRWLIPLGAVVAMTGFCSCCLWLVIEQPRFDHKFAIGEGRTLRVWSERPNLIGPNPLMICYRIDAGNRNVVYPTGLAADDEGDYEFRMMTADNGRLVCVYEVSRAENDSSLFLMFDASTGESWPRMSDNEAGTIDERAAK